MASSEIVPILIAASTASDVDALEKVLIKMRGIRIVGADAWENVKMLRTAVHSFVPQLLVATPDVNVPDNLGVPCLRVTASEDAVAAVTQYLADSAQPEAVPAPAPSGKPPRAAAADPATQPVPAPKLNVPAPQRTVRLGFWGERGGVGTTSAALAAAQELAQRGFRVALCDATERGDTFLWAGFKPQAQPSTSKQWPGLTFYPKLPSDEQLQQYPAVVIDGGRRRRARNVEWVRVTAPISEETIAKLVEKQC